MSQGPEVDVYVDGNRALSGVLYDSLSNYMILPSGTFRIQVTPSESDKVIIDEVVSLSEGKSYTVVAVGDANNLKSLDLLALEDSSVCPAPGQAYVRVVHSSGTAPAIDVYIAGKKALSDVSFKVVSDYLPIPSGRVNLIINLAGRGDVVLRGSPNFTSGHIYTIYAKGILGNTKSAFGLEVVEDSQGMCHHIGF